MITLQSITCSSCARQFIPSSRHKKCPACRHKPAYPCQGCEKLVQKGIKLCRTCFNKSRIGPQKDPRVVAVNYTLKKCKLRSYEIDVDQEYLLQLLHNQKCKCAYTDLPMTLPTFRGCSDRRLCASLDRIDSDKGYVKGNVQWVISPINLMKNSISDTDTKELISWIKG